MTREELAVQLLIHSTYLEAGEFITPRPADIFLHVDAFLAYAAQEREKEKPKAECEHVWVLNAARDHYYCNACRVLNPNVNPPTTSQEPEFDRSDIGGDYMVECPHIHTTSTFTTGLPPKEINRICLTCGVNIMHADPKSDCGAPKVTEQRRPREVWVRFWKDGRVMGASEQELDVDGVLFREVLPGEKE